MKTKIMKTKFNYIVIFATTFLFASCSGSSDSQKSSKSASSSSGYSKDCLESYNYNYPEILTLDEVKKYIPVDDNSLKIEENIDYETYGHVTYQWDSDRPNMTINISNMNIEAPDKNMIKMTKLSFYDDLDGTLELFNRGYKALTNEELAEFDANLVKHYANDPNGLEEARSLMEIRKNSEWEMTDVGQSSFWKWNGQYGLEMAVLAGKTKFYVEVRVDKDPQKNLEVARNIANEILEKCK